MIRTSDRATTDGYGFLDLPSRLELPDQSMPTGIHEPNLLPPDVYVENNSGSFPPPISSAQTTISDNFGLMAPVAENSFAGNPNRTHPWTPPSDPNMVSMYPIPAGHATVEAHPTHPWTPPSDPNMVSHMSVGYGKVNVGQMMSLTQHGVPRNSHLTYSVAHRTSQTMDEPDPRCSDESDETRHDLLECMRSLRAHKTTQARRVFDNPRYVWQHRAYCNLESRLLAKRIGLRFPTVDPQGDPASEDKSICGKCMYPLFRLIAMGEDSPDNISLFLGPNWIKDTTILRIYKELRIQILRSSVDRTKEVVDFEEHVDFGDRPTWEQLTEGMPRWSPRPATVEEDNAVKRQRASQPPKPMRPPSTGLRLPESARQHDRSSDCR